MAAPAGRITALQVFPTGLAASPDGKTVVVIAGPPINGGVPGSPDQGPVALMLIDTASGNVRQVIKVNNAFQSVVFSSDGSTVFVAGGTDGVVHTLTRKKGGLYQAGADLSVCGPADDPNSCFVAGIALAPGGKQLWASRPNTGNVQGKVVPSQVVQLDARSGKVLAGVPVQSPDALAISPDGATLYATAWRGSSVSAISTAPPYPVSSIATGLQPTGIAVIADGRVVVTNSGDATLTTYDPAARSSATTSLAQIGRQSDAPNAVAALRTGNAINLLVSLAGDNALALLTPSGNTSSPWNAAGLIPTGWYPDAVAVSPAGSQIYAVSARGLARSAAPTAAYGVANRSSVVTDPATVIPDGAYGTVGMLQALRVPDGSRLATMTAEVRRTLAAQLPSSTDSRNPVVLGRSGPIKHIIYITRENKTFDADLGDLHPGPGNALVLFGRSVTPNLHALERQYVEPDNFTYQGFASVTGHMWEDTGTVSDVYERSVASDTPGHTNHLSRSWSDPTNYPASGLLVVQALKAGLSVRTYNDETAEQSHLLPDAYQACHQSPCPPGTSLYPDYNLRIPDRTREAAWEQEFAHFEKHDCTGDLATTYGTACQLPDLEYVYFGEDHTTVVDEPGYPTIEAQVADNDYATGKLIDTVSHSADWASTLVVVVEDDPQGTGDHASAYHGLLALASPWVRRGYISNAHYDLTSAVGAIDRILGLTPITDFAATTRPLDDLFTTIPDCKSLQPVSQCKPFQVDDTATTTLYPFVPLPGMAVRADLAHGVYSFAAPDQIDPERAQQATWDQLKGR
jgi:sugar lactone lactonase YvrE